MKQFRKVLAVVLSMAMLLGIFTISTTVTVSATAQVQDETVIIAMSDYQPKDTLGPTRLDALKAALKANGITKADRIFTVGDYSGEYTLEASTNGVNLLKNKFSDMTDVNNMVFTQGNHDLITVPGLTLEGNHDPAYGDYGLYVINEDSYAEWGSYDAASVAALQLYLENKVSIGWNKPIFILNHIPLHWSNRTLKDGSGTNAYKFFNVINDAAGQGLNIIYLFGHNHSSGYDDVVGGSCIFLKKGDTIEVCQGSKKEAKQETLNFTYMNAGYVGYYSSNDASAEKTLTMSVFRIRGNEVIISRYSENGQHNLKSAGITNPDFTGDVLPTTNTDVYAGTWKIAADGSATSVDTVYEKSDDNGNISNGMTSTSEDVKGLAFRFDVTATGVGYTMEKTSYVADFTNANVNVFGDGNYKLAGMGAVVTNKTSVGTNGGIFRLGAVDGKQIIDIPAVYLCDLTDNSAGFAVRVTNIPDAYADKAIYARPYYIYENANGTQITVYGDIVGASYNGKLSNNDGELEW